MDDTLVSSRISRAKKETGVAVLESVGATTSELINSAFDYVIEKRQLPTATPSAKLRKKSFSSFVSQSTLSIDWSVDTRPYKEILRQGKVDDYEYLT